MDKLTKEQRRKNMQAIKGKDSKIELILRKALWKKGYRYRKNYKKLPGCPDIVLVKFKIAIFCDGEFWHGFNWQIRKKEIYSNKAFWIKKIELNIQKDKQVNQTLQNLGWTVLRFWGQDIKKDITNCIAKIEESMYYTQ